MKQNLTFALTLLVSIVVLGAMTPSSAAGASMLAMGTSASEVERPPVKVIEKANGDVFLVREMPDVRSRFLPEPQFPEESHEDPLWLTYLEAPHPSVATMRKYFQEAEKRFGVPAELLMAIGQVQSNWTQYGPSRDGGWGVMHLVKNNYADTLGQAAELLGVDEQRLKDDARLNILGAAAVMADAAGKRSRRFTRLEDWFDAAKVLSALIDDELRQLQAEDYFQRLADGVSSNTLWGEKILLPRRPKVNLEEIKERRLTSIAQASTDYPSAIETLTTCSGNYTATRYGTDIDTWINHWIGTAGGTYLSAISWFKNCATGVSAHFVIRASDGQAYQVVKVNHTAHHAGDWATNLRSIGVEHEVTESFPDGWYNNTLIAASTNMARYFADLYAIPRAHTGPPGIRGHKEIVATTCPGPTMPWGVWMRRLNYGSDGCFCPGGISWWGKSIPKGDAYCGMIVCGGYNSTPELFQCTTGGWVSLHSYNCNCRCTSGLDQFGDPIDPDTTYCGKQVCGTDRQVWSCWGGGSNGGWYPSGIGC